MDIATALANVGLVSKEKAQASSQQIEAKKLKQGKQHQEQAKASIHKSEEKAARTGSLDFRSCADSTSFKLAVKEALLDNPTMIKEVVEAAHRFKNEPGFVKFFFQLRDALNQSPKSKHEQLLNRAFRRRGATFSVSE